MFRTLLSYQKMAADVLREGKTKQS